MYCIRLREITVARHTVTFFTVFFYEILRVFICKTLFDSNGLRLRCTGYCNNKKVLYICIMEKKQSHDQLQSEAHRWLWNTYPNLRYLFHSNFNNLTDYKGTAQDRIRMAKLKSLGLVKGVYDQELLFQGKMYFFDAKLPTDRLSTEQREFTAQNEAHGATCYTYSNLTEFKNIIYGIFKES